MVHLCKMMISLGCFFHFFKILILWVVKQGVSQKFRIQVVRPKFGISEVQSMGFVVLLGRPLIGLLRRPPMGFGIKPLKILAIWHLHVFFISNLIFRVNAMLGLLSKFMFSRLKVAQQLLSNFHFDRPGIKITICKISNFSIVTSICPKYCCTQLRCTKNSCGEIQLQQT